MLFFIFSKRAISKLVKNIKIFFMRDKKVEISCKVCRNVLGICQVMYGGRTLSVFFFDVTLHTCSQLFFITAKIIGRLHALIRCCNTVATAVRLEISINCQVLHCRFFARVLMAMKDLEVFVEENVLFTRYEVTR